MEFDEDNSGDIGRLRIRTFLYEILTYFEVSVCCQLVLRWFKRIQ